MRISILSIILMLCAGCGSARVESAKSLLNADEAVKMLRTTELNDAQKRLVDSISVAMNPAIDYMQHNWRGVKESLKPTVTQRDWKSDPVAAEKAVIYQSAKADSASSKWFGKIASWTTLFYSGVTMLFGASGLAIAKKIMNLKGALSDSIKFGREALASDNDDERAAVTQVANARESNTPHSKELARARVKDAQRQV